MQRIGFATLSASAAITLGATSPPTYTPSPPPAAFELTSRLPAFSHANGGNLGGIAWAERVYTTSKNEPVDVAVSRSYPADQPIGQRWADFFAGLPHGAELVRLEAYVAPLSE